MTIRGDDDPYFESDEYKQDMRRVAAYMMTEEANASGRDDALLAALRNGSFAHLIFVSGRSEQGWIHLHDGRLTCCSRPDEAECRTFQRRAIGADRMTEQMRDWHPSEDAIGPQGYFALDVDKVIQIDLDNFVRVSNEDGSYQPIWHDRRYVTKHPGLGKERQVSMHRPEMVD